MRSVESSAKTMEEAVTQGLEKLGVSFADVKIDILDEGSKGFFGMLGRQARGSAPDRARGCRRGRGFAVVRRSGGCRQGAGAKARPQARFQVQG